MSGIGIILNPHSRSYKHNPERMERLGFIVGDKASCHATHDILDVEALAKEFKEKQIEILGISGGDGTNHVTLSTFLNVYGDSPLPKIAFLRGGTMNNITNALGIKGLPEKILSNLIFKYHAGEEFKSTEVDVMNINGKHGFLFGTGLVCRFMEEYYRLVKKTPFNAGKLLAYFFASAAFNTSYIQKMTERFDAKVTVDGKEWGFKNYVSLHAGTIETFGLHFDPFFRAREKPGHFHLIGLSGTSHTVLVGFPWIFMRKKIPGDSNLEDIAGEVVIELEYPMTYQMDGDVHPATDKITIKTGPRLTAIIS
ncbi:MAG: hypothetical protein COV46_06125 [Deltaproteobacteria bacterium CG11_big_fil_rev_8_21_14_0_20_49_13]|nr:MAG: hypothetical protein COV46_06125 [Deltaproteobacteria bacterium CG11_big_fil_rev_8_21_14_0_20_49_13]